MSKLQFGLRKLIAIIAFSSTAALIAPQAASGTEPYAKTVSFLATAFGSDRAKIVIDGQINIEASLEAMLQLKAAKKTFTQQLPAIKYLMSKSKAPIGTNATGSLDYTGFLFNDDSKKSVNPRLVGKWLFVSEAINVANNNLRWSVFNKLKSQVAKNGVVSIFNEQTGTYSASAEPLDYAWVSLGLNSYREYALANKVVQKMLALQNSNGSFGSESATGESIATTGIALQAINYFQTYGSAAEDISRADAEKRAAKYLVSAAVSDSTVANAQAVMGLKAAGKKLAKLSPYINWLNSNITKSGALAATPGGAGDAVATSQSLTALLGLNYLDLLPK